MNFIPDFHQYIERRRKEYKNFRPVFCGPLGDFVYFNSDGFNHLRFKPDRQYRTEAEQKYKLSLLPGVPRVLATTNTILKRRKTINRRNNIEYVAVVGKWKKSTHLRIILRRSGEGKFYFLSVMKQKNN